MAIRFANYLSGGVAVVLSLWLIFAPRLRGVGAEYCIPGGSAKTFDLCIFDGTLYAGSIQFVDSSKRSSGDGRAFYGLGPREFEPGFSFHFGDQTRGFDYLLYCTVYGSEILGFSIVNRLQDDRYEDIRKISAGAVPVWFLILLFGAFPARAIIRKCRAIGDGETANDKLGFRAQKWQRCALIVSPVAGLVAWAWFDSYMKSATFWRTLFGPFGVVVALGDIVAAPVLVAHLVSRNRSKVQRTVVCKKIFAYSVGALSTVAIVTLAMLWAGSDYYAPFGATYWRLSDRAVVPFQTDEYECSFWPDGVVLQHTREVAGQTNAAGIKIAFLMRSIGGIDSTIVPETSATLFGRRPEPAPQRHWISRKFHGDLGLVVPNVETPLVRGASASRETRVPYWIPIAILSTGPILLIARRGRWEA